MRDAGLGQEFGVGHRRILVQRAVVGRTGGRVDGVGKVQYPTVKLGGDFVAQQPAARDQAPAVDERVACVEIGGDGLRFERGVESLYVQQRPEQLGLDAAGLSLREAPGEQAHHARDGGIRRVESQAYVLRQILAATQVVARKRGPRRGADVQVGIHEGGYRFQTPVVADVVAQLGQIAVHIGIAPLRRALARVVVHPLEIIGAADQAPGRPVVGAFVGEQGIEIRGGAGREQHLGANLLEFVLLEEVVVARGVADILLAAEHLAGHAHRDLVLDHRAGYGERRRLIVLFAAGQFVFQLGLERGVGGFHDDRAAQRIASLQGRLRAGSTST